MFRFGPQVISIEGVGQSDMLTGRDLIPMFRFGPQVLSIEGDGRQDRLTGRAHPVVPLWSASIELVGRIGYGSFEQCHHLQPLPSGYSQPYPLPTLHLPS